MKRLIIVSAILSFLSVGAATAATPCVYHGVQRDFGGSLVGGVCRINTR